MKEGIQNTEWVYTNRGFGFLYSVFGIRFSAFPLGKNRPFAKHFFDPGAHLYDQTFSICQ